MNVTSSKKAIQVTVHMARNESKSKANFNRTLFFKTRVDRLVVYKAYWYTELF